MTTRRVCSTVLAGCLSIPVWSGAAVPAQEMHHGKAPAVRSERLAVRGTGDKVLTVSAEEFARLPHTTVTVVNGHSKANESYSGVQLSVLLARVDVPQGEQVKGAVLLTGVVAEGTDGYQVLYSLAEVDPALHTGEVVVADAVDGKPLGADGAFKLVSTEDKRPARWVRNLSSLTVLAVK